MISLFIFLMALVSMEGGKLSTRSGNVIYAEEILHEAIDKIYEIIQEKES